MLNKMSAAMFVLCAGVTACGKPTADDLWFCADFDSPAELCGHAFLRELPNGDGIRTAGFVRGRFGKGYAFLGPTNRCEGMFWRERRPEAFTAFPWRTGSFVCWHRTPTSVPLDAPGRGFGVGDFRFDLIQSRVFSCASGWIGLPKGMRRHAWSHFAMVWDETGVRAYRDGEEVARKDRAKGCDPFESGCFDLQVGTGGYASMAANLEMDEIAVFKRALSLDEVKELALAKGPLRGGEPRILATPVSLPVYPRNSKTAALRFRVTSPREISCSLEGEIGGRMSLKGDVVLKKGVSDLDVPFEAVRFRPGDYPWRFSLTDVDGRAVLSESGSLKIVGRFDRNAYKVLSWGGFKDLSAQEMKDRGFTVANLHPDRHPELARELAENGLGLSMRIINWRTYVPLDFDAAAIRRGIRSELDYLRGADAWAMSLLNTEMHGTGTSPIWEAAKSPRWRAYAERSLIHGLPATNHFTRAPAMVDWKACGRPPPSGVLGDNEPELEALVWYYRTGHMLYRGHKGSMAEIRRLSPGNVCWTEPIIESWNIAAHHDEICDWVYNYWTHETLCCVRHQQAWVRGCAKPYFPLLSMAYEHNKKLFRENPALTGKDGRPARIFPCRTADDLAIACWQAVGAVPCHGFGFFSAESWERGVANVVRNGRDLSRLQGLVAEPEDQPKFTEFFKSKFLPAAELLRDMVNPRAPVAVLQPVETRYMGGWPVQVHAERICYAIGETGVPYDVIPDAEIRADVLSQYRYIVLPHVQVISKAHHDVLNRLPRTTTLVVDSHCPPSLFPQAVRLEAKFDWLRWNTTAKRAFDAWFAGVTDELHSGLPARSDEDGEFSAQTFLKEHKGARYVLVVNDKRERRDSIMTQVITNDWFKPYGVAQEITTHLPAFKGGAIYEFGLRDARPFGGDRVRRNYAPAEARLFCLHPSALAAPKLQLSRERLEVAVNDVSGRPAAGRTIAEVVVRDEHGMIRDESGRYVVESGRLSVPLYLADDDRAGFATGRWKYAVRDLTTGLKTEL